MAQTFLAIPSAGNQSSHSHRSYGRQFVTELEDMNVKDIITAQALRNTTPTDRTEQGNVVDMTRRLSVCNDRFPEVDELVERLTENSRALAHATS